MKQRIERLEARLATAVVPWIADTKPLEKPLPPIGELLRERGVADADEAGAFLEAHMQQMPASHSLRVLRQRGVEALRTGVAKDRAPLPHTVDRQHYGRDDHAAYWISGLADFHHLASRIPPTEGRPTVLDFGCASGRVLRHFAAHEFPCRLLGADVNRRTVAWFRTHLQHYDVVCFQSTFFPPLPLPAASVDFLYALSVMTHIDEFEEAWLLEFRRLLRPGGRAMLTFHSERTWAAMANPNYFMTKGYIESRYVIDGQDRPLDLAQIARPMPAGRLIMRSNAWSPPHIQAFHSREYVTRSWGRILEVEEIFEQAHGHHQDGVILRRSD